MTTIKRISRFALVFAKTSHHLFKLFRIDGRLLYDGHKRISHSFVDIEMNVRIEIWFFRKSNAIISSVSEKMYHFQPLYIDQTKGFVASLCIDVLVKRLGNNTDADRNVAICCAVPVLSQNRRTCSLYHALHKNPGLHLAAYCTHLDCCGLFEKFSLSLFYTFQTVSTIQNFGAWGNKNPGATLPRIVAILGVLRRFLNSKNVTVIVAMNTLFINRFR